MVYWVLFFLLMLIGAAELIVTQLKIDKDNLTSRETIHKFANDANAELTIMKNGEHWFHTTEQMAFLDDWIRGLLS